ncbi:hypothetical protein [Microbacterium pumilum]|uniref:Uncharacterized protein n=1 Tax=Microbacterium pumilum TaxID=344165 RepID=A0ABP5EC95_9MICO
MAEPKRYVRLLAPSWFDSEGGGMPDKPAGAIVWLLPTGSTFEIVGPGDSADDVSIELPAPFGEILFWIGNEGDIAEIVNEPGPPVEIEAIDEVTAARLFPHIFGRTV